MDQAKLDYFKGHYMAMSPDELVELQGNIGNMTEEAQQALSDVAVFRGIDIVATHEQQVAEIRASIDSEISQIEKSQKEGFPVFIFVAVGLIITALMFLGMQGLAESAVAVMTQGFVLALLFVGYLYWRKARLQRMRRRYDK